MPIINFRLMMRGASPQHLATAHAAIVDEVTRDGKRWISDTVANGHSVIRMMVISYLTGENHLRELEKALINAVRVLAFRAKVG